MQLALEFSPFSNLPNQALTRSLSIPVGTAFNKLAQLRITHLVNQNVKAL